MDLSKLPKLSQTGERTGQSAESAPASPPPPVEATPLDYQTPASKGTGIGADLWFNAIIGLLLIFLGRQFAQYLFSLATGNPFHTNFTWTDGPLSGQEISYPQLPPDVMISDAGIFLFGVVVLLEAAVKAVIGLSKRIPTLLIALVFTLGLASTFYNIFVCIRLMQSGTIPLISALAVAFGGYIIMDSWQMLRAANRLAKSRG